MERLELSKNALLILEERYLRKIDEKRTEEPEDLFRRVAKNISLADAKYRYKKETDKLVKKYRKEFYEITETAEFKNLVRNDRKIKKAEDDFYSLMVSLDFLPNSPTLFNAGRKQQQLSACFVLPIEDSTSSIFMALHDAALVHKTGAGTGFNFSKLRPKGDIIESAGYSSGPVSFMKIFDAATAQIKLGGILRGANIGILNDSHPDIEDFITAKKDPDQLTNFNVSVAMSDNFIEAVKKDGDYALINPRTGALEKKVAAKKIFRLICEQTWLNGDPGVIFIDRINNFNPTPKLGKIESTDSCGEQPLLPYESCNLGSINLSHFVENRKINYEGLKETVRTAVHFLDNVIDMCHYPVKQTRKIVEKNRKIGLGIMGFADLLVKLQIPYDSGEAVKKAEEIMKFISEEADRASEGLAEERGTFPSWNESVYSKKNKNSKRKFMKLRNATRTTIAPTGTISIIANTSSGIEPLFALSYVRKTLEGHLLMHFNPEFKKALEKHGLYNEKIVDRIHREGSIKNIQQIPKETKRIFAVANDIGPEWHVKMQAAFQKYVDNGISKTVTLPKSATVDDIENIFMMAYEMGCKGISIYRFGSREEQVISLSNQRDEQSSLDSWMKK